MSVSTSPPGRYLLDTSVLVALLRGDDAVRAAIEQAVDVLMPATAVGELYYGALHSGNPARNAARITALVDAGTVLACDAETALVYGDVKTGLRERGRPIPENDVWIAAVAVQHGLVLASRDKHFDAVAGLPREAW